MKEPNFFIIGAPKCGTTSLASWLSEHPSVYMSPIKEPMYFCDDFNYERSNCFKDYLSLFENSNEQHHAVGEASAIYLYSKKAVQNIEHKIPDAKYIVLLRNPLEMAPSFYEQLLFDGNENIKSFELAWKSQSDRKYGNRIPRLCRESRFLLYGEVCSLGAQMKRLLNTVPRERVLPVLLDDIKEDPREVWLSILSFLEIPDDERIDFPVKNKAKENRFRFKVYLHKLYSYFLRLFNLPPLGFGIFDFLNRHIVKENTRGELSPAMKQELVEHFEEDIKLLGDLLNRDLKHWLL